MVTADAWTTGLDGIAKVTVVALSFTVTAVGTVASTLSLHDPLPISPPAGAAAPSVTLPVLPTGPVTAAGLTLTPISGGFSVSVTILDAPRDVAVMLACVTAVTVLVLTANVALFAPAATVTDGSTVAALVLLLFSATTAPPAGAAALSVTVPVLFAPPVRLPGFSVIEASAGLTISALEAGGVRTGVGVAFDVGVAFAVGVAFGVDVGVGAGDTSNAPMSMRSFTTRGKPSPRWS